MLRRFPHWLAAGRWAVSVRTARFTGVVSNSTRASSEMVRLEGGEFLMGTDDPIGFPLTEKDQSVRLKPFWIDAYALSNARFAAFAEATGHVTDAERYG
jgi:sulfatase modifying factor 1